MIPRAGVVLDGGWVCAQDGMVVEAGQGAPPAPATDLGDVVLLPGLVNAHTHLELSWMAGLVPPAEAMDQWIGTLMRVRRAGPQGGAQAIVRAAADAAAAMRRAGTVLVGDITNSLEVVEAVEASGLDAVTFHEVLGVTPHDARSQVHDAWIRLTERGLGNGRRSASVVAHAPYSTAPELFRAVAAAHEGPAPLSVHLAESIEEMEFLHHGTGPIRTMLEALEVWTGAWVPPGPHPVRYLASLGYLRPGMLLVHGVHLSVSDLEEARVGGAVIVTCPRSNVWVGGGVPPVARFYASGVDVAIGTDSLASVESLSLFDELAAMRRLAPEVSASRLIDSATRVGAEALGWGGRYGVIAPGARARFVTVDMAGRELPVRDVEEYLVSGVPAATVMPVESGPVR